MHYRKLIDHIEKFQENNKIETQETKDFIRYLLIQERETQIESSHKFLKKVWPEKRIYYNLHATEGKVRLPPDHQERLLEHVLYQK